MFIRSRKVRGPNGAVYVYNSIVETQRVDGKVRQKMLYNMGKRSTIQECIAEHQKWLDHWLSMSEGQYALRARMAGFRSINPNEVAESRAYYQEKIDWLKQAAQTMKISLE